MGRMGLDADEESGQEGRTAWCSRESALPSILGIHSWVLSFGNPYLYTYIYIPLGYIYKLYK